MHSDQVFNVVGLRENGDRVVVARNTSHETAEQIVGLMTAGTGFAELFISADDEMQHADCGTGGEAWQSFIGVRQFDLEKTAAPAVDARRTTKQRGRGCTHATLRWRAAP